MARQFIPFTVRGDGLDSHAGLQYEFSVLGMLHSFDQLKVTSVLMKAFRAAGRDVLVVPYDFTDGPCNAKSRHEWGLFPNKIYFSPSIYYPDGDCVDTGDAGNSPHEVLCHEMVHALRRAANTHKKGTKRGWEEKMAIMITNIFSSETNRPLRKKHADNSPEKDPKLLTSEGYLAAHPHMIGLFVKQHIAVATDLSCIDVPFNPIRAYFHGCAPAWTPAAYQPSANPFR